MTTTPPTDPASATILSASNSPASNSSAATTSAIRILSIQSSVAFGHVGNSAATFPLMRRGIEVWPVNTVHFSNNTSYGSWRGSMLTADQVLDVIRGMDERGVLVRCDAVLSGYQGAEDVGAAVLEAVALVRSRNPKAVYCCDPVMGDVDRGIYVRPAIPDFMRTRVVPTAQVITPNQFELGLLTGMPTRTLADVLRAADAARELGPETVLITSVIVDDLPNQLAIVVATAAGAWQVATPLLPQVFSGAGDLTAGVFLGELLRTSDPVRAVVDTAAIAYGVLSVTAERGSRELELVAAQHLIAEPVERFTPVRLR